MEAKRVEKEKPKGEKMIKGILRQVLAAAFAVFLLAEIYFVLAMLAVSW